MRQAILITTLSFCLLFAAGGSAQVASAPAGAEGVRTFLPADFERYAPQTAYDMVSRIPGFAIRQESSGRGLGQATGNVLINGQRISGKSNDVVTELGRIPARNVERIEIVDGATLEIPGLSGQVANVIVRSTGIKGQYAYRPEFRSYATDPLFTRFEISVGGTRGPVEYTIGLSNPANRSGATGPTAIFDAEGAVVELREDEWKGNADQPRVSARFAYDGPGSAIGNLSLLYGRLYFDYLETGQRTAPGQVARTRIVTSEESGDNYEIAGDYEFELGPGRLKVIGVARDRHTPSETDVVTTWADGSRIDGLRVSSVGDEGETIGRTEYHWKDAAGAEWQLSAEAAFNSLDNVSRLFQRTETGAYDEIDFPDGTARVEEDRYEVMAGYGRSLTPYVGVKIALGGEYSEIAQIGNTGGTRSFERPKGELSVAWQPVSSTDLNVKLARRVGQLNFYDFLASVDIADEQSEDANPDLVPQQSWELDVEGVRRFGDHGTTTLRVYGRLIDDIIDFIPIGATGQAIGNLDQATVYGIQSRNTFNLDRLGFSGARVDASVQWQDSSVDDPLTGESRPISNSLQEASSLSLRHDVPRTDYAWGTGFSYSRYSRYYRVNEVGRVWEGPVWGDVWVEHKDFYGLTLRAAVANLIGADSRWERTVHTGRRTGPVDYMESRDRTIGPIFTFAIRGKF